MRWGLWISLICLLAASGLSAAEEARVVKVLPHFLDLQGRQSLSPSLFQRDAYQDVLRKNPQLRGGLRFDVEWQVRSASTNQLKLKIEARSAVTGKLPKTTTLEKELKWKNRWRHWAAVSISGEDYKEFGELTAWRVTLWDDDTQIAEMKSFLW